MTKLSVVTLLALTQLFLAPSVARAQEDLPNPDLDTAPVKRTKKSRAAAPRQESRPAQDETALNLGFQLGLNVASASLGSTLTTATVSTANTSSKSGLMVGGNLEYGFTRMFFAQTEISYVQKGVSVENAATTGVAATTTNIYLNYLTFTALAKLKFGSSGLVPGIFLGPNLGFLMSASQSTGSAPSADVKANFSGTDFGFDFGAGAEYPLFEVADLFFSVRYSLGLSNVQAVPTTATFNNHGIQLLLGLEFRLF